MQSVGPVIGFYHRLMIHMFMLMDIPSTFKFVTQASELGCGFLLLGYFSRIFNLIGLLFIFYFSLKFLRSPLLSHSHSRIHIHKDHEEDDHHHSNSNSREDSLEDQVFDVMSLRRMVKAERQRYNAACAEIEKERSAAASAAEEAMAMILRLQSEKSSVEIQTNQFRRVIEQKQEYDLQLIHSLRWTVLQLESHNNLLQRQLAAVHDHPQLHQATATDVDEDDDPDAHSDSDSGFLNFSIEYDDGDTSSFQNHSLVTLSTC